MSEIDPIEGWRGGAASRQQSAAQISKAPTQKAPERVTFNRRELDAVLRVYGQMVASGEWRDYAIDHLRDQAIFSIFRRSTEFPVYRVVKTPKLSKRQGMYSVVAASGLIMKRGHDLNQVLKVFDRQKLRLV